MSLARPMSRLVVAALTVVSVAAATSPTSAHASGFSCSSSSNAVYQVASGDSWYGIAAQVEVTPIRLATANGAGLDDALVVGDRLCLPNGAKAVTSCSSGGSTHTVAPGDSWYGIAARFGVSPNALLGANAATVGRAIHAGERLCLPAGGSSGSSGSGSSTGSYNVAAGDSWYGIADRADVPVRALLESNDASSSSLLLPGRSIRLPAGATQPSSRPTSSGEVALESAPIRGACWFSDTWHSPRPGGRSHLGTDIIAAPGHYVRAVVDGKLIRRAWDQPGKRAGNAWTLAGADGSTFFYGHLADFAPGLAVGSWVEAGEIIGFVGRTGNATAAHLHFEIRPRGGSPTNPYRSLLTTGECSRALTFG